MSSKRETLLKIQVNSMLDYLVNELKYPYYDSLEMVLSSATFHRLTENDLYLNQGTLYVLDDLKQEFANVQPHNGNVR